MTTPRGAPELVSAQALPETTVNEQIRRTEAGAGRYPVADRVTAPPGTCADGATYLIIATATGAFAGKENQLATAVGTNAASGWLYRTLGTIDEGVVAYVQDEDAEYKWSGSAWALYTGSGVGSTASTTEQLTGTDSAKAATPDSVAALWEQGADVASAGTVSLGEGGYFKITGTTTITDIDFAIDKAGRAAWLRFAGALTLTHNATTLILPTGSNITTAAGDTACFVSEGSDVVRCVAYQRADGTSLVAGTSYSDEQAQDAVAAMFAAGTHTNITVTYNDVSNSMDLAASGTITSSADGSIDAQFFGDGSDGSATISSGTTTLTSDMYYSNLTISGTGQLNTAGFRVFVSGTLDISAAPAAAIYAGNSAGTRNGSNGTNQVGGSAGVNTVSSASTLATGGAAGSSGATGGTGAGSAASAVSAANQTIATAAGAGGAGGAVGGTAGGNSRAATASTQPMNLRRLSAELATFSGSTYARISGGAGGPGGSAGAGDGTGSGGGGGGGGAGGGVVFVAARTINRSGSTAAGAISAAGGNGGNGGVGTGGTNRGGGGGGAGGGGGLVYVVFRTLSGSTATNCLDATGGNGGSGANGTGTGIGGDGGGAGGGGRIDVYNLGAGTNSITSITSAVAGNAHSSGTGGAALTATAQKVNL